MTTSKEKDEQPTEKLKTNEKNDKPAAKQESKSEFWGKVSGTAGKGLESLKKGVEKVTHFAGSSAKLAKLKLEIHNLKIESESLSSQAGEKLWKMSKEKRLEKLETTFATEFKKMAGLQKQIHMTEKQVTKTALVE